MNGNNPCILAFIVILKVDMPKAGDSYISTLREGFSHEELIVT